MQKQDIRAMTEPQLRAHLDELGLPGYRFKQIVKWLNAGVSDFSQMTDLPLALRQQLSERFFIPGVRIARKWESKLDETVKYLFELQDGETVESVLMSYKHGWSQCLSTQVGCKMGCTFCATGMGGFIRNLTAAEMIAQIEAAEKDRGIRVSSVVLMGMGEPLDNYDEVLRFLHMLKEDGGVHIGMRHVSLSTCGLVDQIYRLMDEKLQLTLSVSLHAPNDQIRSPMMPVNRKWPVDTLLEACRRYAETTGRRISYEYAMVDGVNDSDACAYELAGKLKGTLCHVNLIPLNPVDGSGKRASCLKRIQSFQNILAKSGITATVRRKLGADISASCGQLRRKADREKSNG